MVRRVQGKLTQAAIDRAKPKLRPNGECFRTTRFSDGGNLYLNVSPSGSKSWTFLYKMPGCPPRQLGLGPLEHVDARAAREKAAKARGLLYRGEDPMLTMGPRTLAKLRPRNRVRTFREVAEQAITSLEGNWGNKKTPKQWRSSLKAYAYPAIGEMAVDQITTRDVAELLKPIWDKKEVGGVPETASRVRARIEKVLDYAKASQLRSGPNPAELKGNLAHMLPRLRNVKKRADGKKAGHAMLPWKEVPAFMEDVRAREGSAARAMEFAILTCARTSEALGAKWSEIDLEEKVWVIPGNRMKMGVEHHVPLTDATIDLLNALPREESADLVFIGPNHGKPLSNMAMLAVLKRMKRTDVTVHGFRATFRTWAAEATVYPREIGEKCLAHEIGSAVERAYLRSDLFDKRTALMDDWAAYCAAKPKDDGVEA
jgi:integrase